MNKKRRSGKNPVFKIMINVKDFRTPSFIMDAENDINGIPEGIWPMAIDYGFSSTDGYVPNSIFCIPTYAKKINSEGLMEEFCSDTDIYLKNETGLWAVGKLAQEMSTNSDISETAGILCGRNRYNSPMFKAITLVGLALGLKERGNRTPEGKSIVLQTGLPPLYLKEDAGKIKKVLAGSHEFDLKIGKNPWKHYKFELLAENIYVIPQPLGSLYSAICSKDGSFIPDAEKILSSISLIIDGGFGTLDVAKIKNKTIDFEDMYTDENFGMKVVLQRTIDKIFKKSQTYYQLSAFQKCLEDGYYTSFDEDTMETSIEPFDDMLESSSSEVCEEMLTKLKQMNNGFRDIANIILTGGTCAAWEEYIKKFFEKKEDTNVICSNENEPLPMLLSNVRGYYFYLLAKLRAAQRG